MFEAIPTSRLGALRVTLLLSAGLHIGVVIATTGPAPPARTPPPRPPQRIVVFAAPSEPEVKPPEYTTARPPDALPAPDAGSPGAAGIDDPAHPQITFAPDPTGERLHEVLQRFRGEIGFASADDVRNCEARHDPTAFASCVYQYRFSAPNWDRVDGDHFSLQGYFLVKLVSPPPYVRVLRSRHAIPDGYVAYGLLPEIMREDVDDSVEEELSVAGQARTLMATAVEISFAVTERRGFRLRILATKARPDSAVRHAGMVGVSKYLEPTR
jgi:hypothetical protein